MESEYTTELSFLVEMVLSILFVIYDKFKKCINLYKFLLGRIKTMLKKYRQQSHRAPLQLFLDILFRMEKSKPAHDLEKIFSTVLFPSESGAIGLQGRMFALHIDIPGLIPGTPYGLPPTQPSRVIIQFLSFSYSLSASVSY